MSEKIKGGLADNKTVEDIAKKHGVSIDLIRKQLEKGIKVEKEHTDSIEEATEIALDHLMEDAYYYDKLETIEPQHGLDEEATLSPDIPLNSKVNTIGSDNPYLPEPEKEKRKQQFNENAYLRKMARETNTSIDFLQDKWKIAKEKAGDKKNPSYWKQVHSTFESELRSNNLEEARRIMDNREQLRSSIENFLDNLAKDDYDSAQKGFPDIVKYKVAEMINSRKEPHKKEMEASIKAIMSREV